MGWASSTNPDASLVIKALDMAYEQRGRPHDVLFHRAANMGVEFSAKSVTTSFKQSMNRRGV